MFLGFFSLLLLLLRGVASRDMQVAVKCETNDPINDLTSGSVKEAKRKIISSMTKDDEEA